MSEIFRRSIGELWAALGLPPPQFDDGARVELVIDEISLILQDSDDGEHLVVSGVAGQLSRQRRREAEQIEALLRSNLGHLALARPCLRLRPGAAGSHDVEVVARHPYRARSTAALKTLIEDVLARLELHAGLLLEDGPMIAETRARNLEMSQSDTMIFRP
jgi:Tir chaperone protein (CesT) family